MENNLKFIVYLGSRMREICTYGSERGIRTPTNMKGF